GPPRRRRGRGPRLRWHRGDPAHLPRRERPGAVLRLLRLQGGRTGSRRHPRRPGRLPRRRLHAAAAGLRPRTPPCKIGSRACFTGRCPLGMFVPLTEEWIEMLRYTLMRLGIFAGCFLVVWGL